MRPTMVKFLNFLDNEIGYGIELDDGGVICGCCGGIFEKEDVDIKERLSWIDIQYAIKGE